MKLRLLCILILFSILITACAANGVSDSPASDVKDITEQETRALPAESANSTPVQTGTMVSSSTPIAVPEQEQPTATPTALPDCSPPDGCSWSYTFSSETGYIIDILPAGDGNYLISGPMDEKVGTWVIKIDPDGNLLWQKQYGKSFARLKPALNGNFLLEYFSVIVEIDNDGTIVNAKNTYWYQPNEDGTTTAVQNNQAIKLDETGKPIWQLSIENSSISGSPTTDGGAIFAYGGAYLDKSVYYMPTLTDIKVIKIDTNGQVYQHVYGKLVGEETLDFVQATDDGGAILAGTHAYEELGTDYDIWLMKVNKAGSLSWQATLKSPPDRDSLMNLYVLPNGYLVHIENYMTDNIKWVYLSKSGNLVWQKEINSARGSITIDTVAQASDGSIYFSGQTNEKNNVYFLAHLDTRGNLLWEKIIGLYGLEDVADSSVSSILPLHNGQLLVGGSTNVLADFISDTHAAWIANLDDSGEILGLLNLTPGKFSIIGTLSARPNTLPDTVLDTTDLQIDDYELLLIDTDFQQFPACMVKTASQSGPQELPTLTPSMTPTEAFVRDLYLTNPENMQGPDVLKLQQRLLELGYSEVGVPDGIFGSMTQNAVRLFQERNELEVDGYVGKLTWSKLFSDTAVPHE